MSFGTLRSENRKGICYTSCTHGIFCKTIKGKYILRYKGSDPFIIFTMYTNVKGCLTLFSHLRTAADSTINTCTGEEGAMQRAGLKGAPNKGVLSCTFRNGQGGLKEA